MIPKFKFHGREFFLELSVYLISKQPKVILAVYPCSSIKSKTIISHEYPSLDLRAYDADFNFKRKHGLIRKSGAYLATFKSLVGMGILKPTESAVVDGNVIAQVCELDMESFVILPENIESELG